MKPSSILSEAWRNIASGTARTLTAATAMLAIALIAVLLDATTILNLQTQATQWATAGAAIHILADEQQINPTSCTNLSRTTGTTTNKSIDIDATLTAQPIQASGALKDHEDITLNAMKAAPLSAYAVTPGMAGVLGVDRTAMSRSGVWISSQLAATLHARAGDTLPTTNGDMSIAGIFNWPDDNRDQRIAFAVLVPTASSEPYDECWASIMPSNQTAEDLLNTTPIATPNAANAAQTTQANHTLGTSMDASNQYQQRISRYLTLITPLAALLIGFITVRSRRIELADNLHMGQSKTSLWVTNAIETLAWSLPAVTAAAGMLTLIVAVASDAGNAATIATVQAPALALSLITAQLGSTTELTAITATKLFTYFKNRQ